MHFNIKQEFSTVIKTTQELTSYSAVLGVVIANNRKLQCIEQGEVAKKMGLSQSSYSRLESGKSSFSVDQMFQSVEALNLPFKDLFNQLCLTIELLRQNKITVKGQLRRNSTEKRYQEQKNTNFDTYLTGEKLSTLISSLSEKIK